MIEILEIGSDVVVDGEIPAKIIAVELRGVPPLITYQCVWWDERARKSEWVTETEVRPKDPARNTRIAIK